MSAKSTRPLHPAAIRDALMSIGAAVSWEVPLDRAGRNVADVVAITDGCVHIVEVKPRVGTTRDMDQLERYVRAGMKLWPNAQVYGILAAPSFAVDVVPRGHLFVQVWPA